MPYEIFSADQTDAVGNSRLVEGRFWSGPAKYGTPAQGNLRDGDFDEAHPIEAPRFEFPFQEQGDRSTVMLRQKWVQAIEKFQAQPSYTVHPDKSDAYLINEGPMDDRGGGVGIWERVYCTLPLTRVEYEKFPYSYQYIASSTSLGAIVRNVMSQLKYEYFLERDRAAFPPLEKLEVEVLQSGSQTLFYKSGVGNLTVAAPSYFFVSSDPLVVAEPSEVKTWKHPIMYRATRYVPGPTLERLGQTTTLPLPS